MDIFLASGYVGSNSYSWAFMLGWDNGVVVTLGEEG